MHTVQMETTLSDQALVKSWMICDAIGSGRFGNVRLAINPSVRYRKKAQSLEDLIPSPTTKYSSSYAAGYSPTISDVIIVHKFWADIVQLSLYCTRTVYKLSLFRTKNCLYRNQRLAAWPLGIYHVIAHWIYNLDLEYVLKEYYTLW